MYNVPSILHIRLLLLLLLLLQQMFLRVFGHAGSTDMHHPRSIWEENARLSSFRVCSERSPPLGDATAYMLARDARRVK